MNTPALPPELQKFRLLRDVDAAAILGIAPQTLRNARVTRKGPFASLPYRHLGTAVRYALADVLAFSESCREEAAG